MSAFTLSPEELNRYSRHLRLPGFTEQHQLKLKATRVLLVGAGGLGCPIGLYLAAAGVGTLGVVDNDVIEVHNLQRQIAHNSLNIGLPKVHSLIQAMRNINPLLSYQAHSTRLNADNVIELISKYDLIIDGSDNFATRYLLADACYFQGIPLLHGAVYQYEAQMALFPQDGSACYRCLFPTPPTRNGLAPCDEIGIFGMIPGTVGTLMATEAVKWITGIGPTIEGQLLRYNAIDQTIQKLRMVQDEACPLCSSQSSIQELEDATQAACDLQPEPESEDLSDYILSRSQARHFIANGAFILDVREPFEYGINHLHGAYCLPLGSIEASTIGEIPKNEPVLAYCQKGARSLQAVQRLRALGLTKVFSLEGGLAAWNEPLESENKPARESISLSKADDSMLVGSHYSR